MALALDSTANPSGPVGGLLQDSGSTTNAPSAAFSCAASRTLVVVLVAATRGPSDPVVTPATVDWSDASGNSVSPPTGCSAWTKQEAAEDATFSAGSLQIWTATVGSTAVSGARYRVICPTASPSKWDLYALLYAYLSNSGGTVGIGAVGVTNQWGNGTTNTAIAATVNATKAGSQIVGVFINSNATTAFTANSTTVFDDQRTDTTGGTNRYACGRLASSSGGSVAVTGGAGNVTIGATASDEFIAAAAIEITETTSAGAVLQAAGTGGMSGSAALTTSIAPAAAGTGKLSGTATLSSGSALQASGTGKLTGSAALTTGIALAAAGGGKLSASAVLPAFTFPIAVHSSGRYLVDVTGKPLPILGDSAWEPTGNLTEPERFQLIQDRAARGFTASILDPIEHKYTKLKPPQNAAGALPFTLRLDGGGYTGSPNGTTTTSGNGVSSDTGGNTYSADPYSNVNNESPDFTTPNTAFWTVVDSWISLCASNGTVVFIYPAYFGFAANDEGWNAEMVANDAITGAGGQTGQSFADATKSKLWNYGAWLANRYKGFGNIVWILGGDSGQNGTSGAGTFNAAQSNAVLHVYQGMHSISSALSQNWTGHWGRNTLASDISNDVTNGAALAAAMTLESTYPNSDAAQQGRAAYSNSPAQPAFDIEDTYEGDEVGPNRRLQIWTLLSAGAGYFFSAGVGTTGSPGSIAYWGFPVGWQNQLTTQTALDMQRVNAWWSSLPWWRLVPSGLSGMKTLVTSGGGTASPQTTDYVSATATVAGDLLLAYVPPAHTGTITVDMTAMAGLTRSRWWDPTSGGYTADATGLANTGTHVFTPPGSNSAGATDFVLVLDTSLLAAAGGGSLSAAASLSTSIALAMAAQQGLTGAAALATSLALSAAGAAQMSAAAQLSTAIRLAAAGTGSLSGVAALAGGAILQASGSGSLVASAALSTAIAMQAGGTGNLSGSAALGAPAAQLAAAMAGGLTGISALTTAVRMAAAGLGSLTASASLTAGASVRLARGVPLLGQPSLFPTLNGQAAGFPVLLGMGDF